MMRVESITNVKDVSIDRAIPLGKPRLPGKKIYFNFHPESGRYNGPRSIVVEAETGLCRAYEVGVSRDELLYILREAGFGDLPQAGLRTYGNKRKMRVSE